VKKKPSVAKSVEESSVKEKDKGGRPLKEIDAELVGKLASIHCTKREIASIVGCHIQTLDHDRFTDILQKGQDEGKMSLKRKMFEVALKGNCAMLIWLSKQHLGMRDKQPDEVQQLNYTVVINEPSKVETIEGKK
jgi:hypothetical protein